MDLSTLRNDLKKLANPKKAKILQGFFKTGKGQYGEGDVFWGITVPQSRSVAQKYKDLHFAQVNQLLKSKVHEERLIALLILVHNFQHATPKGRRAIFDFYLKSTRYINNWDLVDLSADKIVGEYLLKNQGSTSHQTVNGKNFDTLRALAKSPNVWERRIAVLSTYQFVKHNRFGPTLQIAGMLLTDQHDLIHKAVGWMLREVGKRDQRTEERFLKSHYKTMPRTMLRYAIERFGPSLKASYMAGDTFG